VLSAKNNGARLEAASPIEDRRIFTLQRFVEPVRWLQQQPNNVARIPEWSDLGLSSAVNRSMENVPGGFRISHQRRLTSFAWVVRVSCRNRRVSRAGLGRFGSRIVRDLLVKKLVLPFLE
jgi:hypothetical protein